MKSINKKLNQRIDVPGGIYEKIYEVSKRFFDENALLQKHGLMVELYVTQRTTLR